MALRQLADGSVVTFTPAAPVLADEQAKRLQALADLRWKKEESGTAVDGTAIATDRTTQDKLIAGYIKATADDTYAIADWKFGQGAFGALNAATIIAAANAVEAHVQACFTNEATLSASIMAATDMTELEAVDIETGWP